ncbi:MAG: AIPR family protein, partial [Candidatus Gracilibacteria bacterium]|nr:AIPR family protein [Candidatus Gracilibacteria bacterium]
IPYDEKYFFEDGSDRGFIARVKCSDIKNSIIEYGDKIFQKNIRGKLASCINQDIKKTLENNSNEFFLLNNGITIIGSEINPMKDGTLSIKNAQIINGQQTSRVITETKNIKDDAYILCRFFEVDNKKIKKITQTTNSQNSTNERDFVANDDLQIAIQEYFHEKGIFYGRKNKEINKYVHKKKIHNKEFAQSCLALILEKPSEARVPSSKKFFTNDKNKKGIQIGFYDTIFSQNIEDMCKAFEIYDQSYKKIKEGISGEGIDLSSEGWLHIASIWYRKNYKTYEEAFAIFEKFFKKENFEQLMKKGEKPLNKKDTDEKLILFLKTFKK